MPPDTGSIVRNRVFIVLLSEAVLYSALWLWNENVAGYITLVFPAMILVILILAGIADWIEPSRIPGWYYLVMIASILIPLIIAAVFYFINDGKMDWLSLKM